MTGHFELTSLQDAEIDAAIDHAVRAIPPAWSIAAYAAVNPYVGQTNLNLPETAALLNRVAGAAVTMPRAWYQAKITAGEIADADLEAALADAGSDLRPANLAVLKAAAAAADEKPTALPTIADLAREVSGIDWPRVIEDRIGHWAAGYFDRGQALWASPLAPNAYSSWRRDATYDLTPEIAGLQGFAAYVAQTPMSADVMIGDAAMLLGLHDETARTYFHQLLLTLAGWGHYARFFLWRAELDGRYDNTTVEMLAIRLVWEAALFEQYRDAIADRWVEVREAHGTPPAPTADMVVNTILHEAYERAAQRRLATVMATPKRAAEDKRPLLQSAFCIDVRSEVFRRNLEASDPGIQTIGYAGFFGLSISHKGFASDLPEHRMPAILNSQLTSSSTTEKNATDDLIKRFNDRAKRAWGRFKLAAVSSFAFVEAAGLVYGLRVIRDALGLQPAMMPDGPTPHFVPDLPLDLRVEIAAKVLRAMTLTGNFARLVTLIGHGSCVANNPHASSLQCGACAGHSGEVNARLLAGLLNDAEVREGLRGQGIDIPDDTLFVGGLHDTTTDRIKLYDGDHAGSSHMSDIKRAREWFGAAGVRARIERAARLPRGKAGKGIMPRASDWSEIRPEWGLAGCRGFIVAPRELTAGKNLAGQTFLYEYDCAVDPEAVMLEQIMTSSLLIVTWINLQYYGSAVAPDCFGAGNKLLHNITGGIGVVEGNGGALRIGLPRQLIHDGEKFTHEPLRLSVCIRASQAAITDVLSRQEAVRQLFDNKWLHLFVLDDNGSMVARYKGNLEWTSAGEF